MKLDKAIELIGDVIQNDPPCWEPDTNNALKLGIEALKLIQAYRKWLETNLCCGLPGEDPPDPKTIPIETLVKIRESPLCREPKG